MNGADKGGQTPGVAQSVPGSSRRRWWLALAATIPVIATVGFFAFATSIATEPSPLPPRADGMIVLTGGAERVSDAIRLLADGHARRLLITGVSPGTSALDIAKHTAVTAQILDCCVDLGYAARNTAGNAEEAGRWARDHGIRGSIIIVTSSYHMPRALVEMRRRLAGYELIAFPVVPERLRDRSWWNDLELFRVVATEYVKFLYARARGVALTVLSS